MIFSDKNDVSRCIEIVRKKLAERNVSVNEEVLKKITEDIMNISYSKGGDYSDGIIRSFAEVYIKERFYKKFLI